MNEKQKDVLIRAVRTFWQAMVAYLLADVTVLQSALTDWPRSRHLLLTLGIGAVAAGLSAVYNALIRPWMEGDGHGKQF